MAKIYLTHTVELLVGVVNILDVANKPGVAKSISVKHRHRLSTLQRQNEVFGVKHVEHGVDRVACHLCHVALSLSYCRVGLLHLWRDVSVDELLIAAKLCSMIAADALVVIRGLVLVERV